MELNPNGTVPHPDLTQPIAMTSDTQIGGNRATGYKPHLGIFETFWYYAGCILSVGGLYIFKLAAKKALIELERDRL